MRICVCVYICFLCMQVAAQSAMVPVLLRRKANPKKATRRSVAIHPSFSTSFLQTQFPCIVFHVCTNCNVVIFFPNVTQVAALIHTCRWKHRVRCYCRSFDITQLHDLSLAVIQDMASHKYRSRCAAHRANDNVDPTTQLHEWSLVVIHDMATHAYNSCCAAQRANDNIDVQ